MKLEVLLVFIGIFALVASHSVRKRYYAAPVDREACEELSSTCLAKLAVVGNLLNDNGFTNLVTDGSFNLDCSCATQAAIDSCLNDTKGICRSALDFELKLWPLVYTYICNKQTAFTNAEVCLESGVPDRARTACQVGADYYGSESKCRTDPTCMFHWIIGWEHSQWCSEDHASLFKEMVKIEYTTKMEHCSRLMY